MILNLLNICEMLSVATATVLTSAPLTHRQDPKGSGCEFKRYAHSADPFLWLDGRCCCLAPWALCWCSCGVDIGAVLGYFLVFFLSILVFRRSSEVPCCPWGHSGPLGGALAFLGVPLGSSGGLFEDPFGSQISCFFLNDLRCSFLVCFC